MAHKSPDKADLRNIKDSLVFLKTQIDKAIQACNSDDNDWSKMKEETQRLAAIKLTSILTDKVVKWTQEYANICGMVDMCEDLINQKSKHRGNSAPPPIADLMDKI